MKMLLFCCLLSISTTTSASEKNLTALHVDLSKMNNKECLACHADITKAKTGNKKIKTFHRLHLESRKETPKRCAECHQSVDLREGSAAALRKQVDPQLCAGCHSGDMKGAKVLYER